MRNWVKQRTGMECNFSVRFYPGRYATEKCSILPVGDPTAYIADEEVSHQDVIRASCSERVASLSCAPPSVSYV